MTLADLRDGDRVLIDANIFIYHFGGRSLECKALLERCPRRALLGYTSTPVLAAVLHRRMVAKAIAQGLVPPELPYGSSEKHRRWSNSSLDTKRTCVTLCWG